MEPLSTSNNVLTHQNCCSYLSLESVINPSICRQLMDAHHLFLKTSRRELYHHPEVGTEPAGVWLDHWQTENYFFQRRFCCVLSDYFQALTMQKKEQVLKNTKHHSWQYKCSIAKKKSKLNCTIIALWPYYVQ